MALTGYKRRLLRQPSGLVRVNPSHWLADRLIFASTGADAFVEHQRAAPSLVGLPPIAGGGNPGPFSSIQQATPDGSNYTRYSIPPMEADGFSLVCWQYGIAGTSANNIFSVGNSSSSDGSRSIIRLSDETFSARRSTSAYSNAGPVQAGFVSGRWQQISATFTSATVSAVYVDSVGNEASGNSRAATTLNAVYIGTSWVGGATRDLSQTVIQGIGPCFVISGVLSADEVARFFDEQNANPWGVFSERMIWVPISSGGSSVPTITAVSAENITSTSADYRVTLDFA